MTRFLMILAIMIINSCTIDTMEKPLEGKVVIGDPDIQKYYMYSNSDTVKSIINIEESPYKKSNIFTWLNTKDEFLGSEYIIEINNESKSNIVIFDLTGKVIDTLYKSKNNELAWPLYSSRNDEYFLFTLRKNTDQVSHPLEGLNPLVSLLIINKDKVITNRIDNIGRLPNFQVNESPWLHDNKRFVYSMRDNKLESNGVVVNPISDRLVGIYIFDIETNNSEMLISEGSSAIISPIKNEIAYEKNNSIRIYNIDTNTDNIVYSLDSNDKIRSLHWAPNGKCIYFSYTHYWNFLNLFYENEKLINISNKTEVKFKKIKHGFNFYTWK